MDARRVISKQPGTIDLAKSIERKYRFILVNATLLFQFSRAFLSCRKIATLDYFDCHKYLTSILVLQLVSKIIHTFRFNHYYTIQISNSTIVKIYYCT